MYVEKNLALTACEHTQLYTQSLDLTKAIHSQSGTSLIMIALKGRISMCVFVCALCVQTDSYTRMHTKLLLIHDLYCNSILFFPYYMHLMTPSEIGAGACDPYLQSKIYSYLSVYHTR